jgi:menaquinone-dependent protoporphyrinogen oxidase
MRVLLVYGTTDGHTRKVASFMQDALSRRGHAATLHDAAASVAGLDIGDFDAAIVAASLHIGRYQTSVRQFVVAHRAALQGMPAAFVSVSLAVAGRDEDDRAGLERCIADFSRETGWTPRRLHHAAGALRYTHYGLLKRWALRYISWREGGPTDVSHDHELTDWLALDRFVDKFCAAATAGHGQRA